MVKRLVSSLAASTLTAAAVLGTLAQPAGAANTFNVQVTASTTATVTVTTSNNGNVICDVGSSVSGLVPCTNTVTATGNIRTRAGGTGAIAVTAPAATVTGTSGNSVAVANLKMTCSDAGSTGTHGTATFASSASSSTTAVACATWPGPDVFLYNVLVSYSLEASAVNADTYTLSSGWAVTASAT